MSTTYQLVQDFADPSTGLRFDDPLDPSLSTGTRNIRWLTIPTFWGALKNVVFIHATKRLQQWCLLQFWPKMPNISTNKTPFIECTIPFITSYN